MCIRDRHDFGQHIRLLSHKGSNQSGIGGIADGNKKFVWFRSGEG